MWLRVSGGVVAQGERLVVAQGEGVRGGDGRAGFLEPCMGRGG